MKIFLTILTTFIEFTSIAQKQVSRAETEEWLLSKMNKYVAASTFECYKMFPEGTTGLYNKVSNCSEYTGTTFNFKGDSLVINAKVKREEYNDNETIVERFSRRVVIPICDLASYDSYINGDSLCFKTKFSVIKFEDSNMKSSKWSSFFLKITTFDEEDFIKRFNKAMNHLRTFIKKTKSKEVF